MNIVYHIEYKDSSSIRYKSLGMTGFKFNALNTMMNHISKNDNRKYRVRDNLGNIIIQYNGRKDQ